MLISSNYSIAPTDELPEVKCKIAHWDKFEQPKVQRAERIAKITIVAVKIIVPLCLLLFFYTPLWVPLGLGIPALFALLIIHNYNNKKVVESTTKYKSLRYFEVKLKNDLNVELRGERGREVAERLREMRTSENELTEAERNDLETIRSDLNGRQQLLSDHMMENELNLRNRSIRALDRLDYLDLGGSPRLQERLRAMELAQDSSIEQQWTEVRKQVVSANRALLQGDVRKYQARIGAARREALEIGGASSHLHIRLPLPSLREDINKIQNLFADLRAKLSNVKGLHDKVPAHVSIVQQLTPKLRDIEANYQNVRSRIPIDLKRVEKEVYNSTDHRLSFREWYINFPPAQRLAHYAAHLPQDHPRLMLLNSHLAKLNESYGHIQIEQQLYQGQRAFEDWFFNTPPEDRLTSYNQRLGEDERLLALRRHVESDLRSDCTKLWKIDEGHLEDSLHTLMGKLLPLEKKLNKWLEKHHPQTRIDLYKQEIGRLRETIHNPRVTPRIERAWQALEQLEEQIASFSTDAQKNQQLDRFNNEQRSPMNRAVTWDGETSLLKIACKILFPRNVVEPIELGERGTAEYSLKNRIQQLDKSMVRLNRIRKICIEGIVMHLVAFAVSLVVTLFFPYMWLIGGFVALLVVGGIASLYMDHHLKQKDDKIRALKQTLQFWSVLRSHPNIPRELNDQLSLLNQITSVLQEHRLFGVALTENLINHYGEEVHFSTLIDKMLQHERPTVEEEKTVVNKELAALRQIQQEQNGLAEEINNVHQEINEAKQRLARGELCRAVFKDIKQLDQAIQENHPLQRITSLFEDIGNLFKHLIDPENALIQQDQYPRWLTCMIRMAIVIRQRGIDNPSFIRFLQTIIPLLEQEESFDELNSMIGGIRRLARSPAEIGRICETLDEEVRERVALDYGRVRENAKKEEKSEKLQSEYPSIDVRIQERETLLNSL